MIHTDKKDLEVECIKSKNCCSLKDTIKQMKRQITDWEDIFTKHKSAEGQC
jgi:hypothetical protein